MCCNINQYKNLIMVKSFISSTPKIILEKLNRLLSALQKAKKTYEQTASTVNNKQIRYTILGLAQESGQYANELMSHIEILGGEAAKPQTGSEFKYDHLSEKKEEWEIKTEKDRLQDCSNNENLILDAYHEALAEPVLYENIRKMIKYQLVGLLHSFSQLKLLKTSL